MKTANTSTDFDKATAEIIKKLDAMPKRKHFFLGVFLVGFLQLVCSLFIFS